MKKLSELDNKLKSNKFLTPDFVYIPIHAKKVSFAPKSYVYDSTLLLIDDNKRPVFSSVSGNLIGTTHVMTTNGRMNAMVIENDFLEKRKTSAGRKRQIFKMKKEEMNTILDSFNLNFGFTNKETLMIHLSYDKNTNLNDRFSLKDNVVEILEITDALSSAYDIKSVIFAVPDTDYTSYDILNEYIGTYHNFVLSETKYNADNKDKSAKKMLGKNKENYTVITLNDIEAIGNALKSKRLLKNKYVTISGSNLKKPIVAYTKIGICVSELLAWLKIDYKENEIKVVGSSKITCSKNEAVVTRDLESIILTK